MKILRNIIEIDDELCNGCGECVPSCAEGAIRIVGGKAVLVEEKFCDGLGACLGHCPTGALRVVQREADDFDEAAVEAHLASGGGPKECAQAPIHTACACPSAAVRHLASETPEGTGEDIASLGRPGNRQARLSNWPIQIRLVPATAPFLKNADILVAADCTAAAYPDFHQVLVRGRAVLLGCPKLDDAPGAVRRLTEIFKTASVRSVTTVSMEVPCCGGLSVIVKKAMEAAGVKVPVNNVLIGIRGSVLSQGMEPPVPQTGGPADSRRAG